MPEPLIGIIVATIFCLFAIHSLYTALERRKDIDRLDDKETMDYKISKNLSFSVSIEKLKKLEDKHIRNSIFMLVFGVAGFIFTLVKLIIWLNP